MKCKTSTRGKCKNPDKWDHSAWSDATLWNVHRHKEMENLCVRKSERQKAQWNIPNPKYSFLTWIHFDWKACVHFFFFKTKKEKWLTESACFLFCVNVSHGSYCGSILNRHRYSPCLWSSPLINRNLNIELLHQNTHDIVALAVNFQRC